MIGSKAEMNAALASFDDEMPPGSRASIDYVGNLEDLVGLAVSKGLSVTMRRFDGVDTFEVRKPGGNKLGLSALKGEMDAMKRATTVLMALNNT